MVARAARPLSDTLRAITDAAPGLRQAGVLRVVAGDIDIRLAPPPPPEPPRQGDADRRVEPDIGDLDGFLGETERARRAREDVS